MRLRLCHLSLVVSAVVASGTLVVSSPARAQASGTSPPRFEPGDAAPARPQPTGDAAPARARPIGDVAPARPQPAGDAAPARARPDDARSVHPRSGEVVAAPVTAGEEAIDDPKLARRLGTRAVWVSPPATAPTSVPEASRRAVTSDVAPISNGSAGGSPPDVSPSSSPAVVSQVVSPPEASTSRSPPRLKLAFRRFDFVRIGAAGAADGSVASEPFDSVSIDVYPLSSFVRIGLSTQYGWQAGAGFSGGDYFANESLSLGVQLLGRPVVPFAESFAGIGYMRRLQFDRTVPTAYWQFGVDVGAELYFARTGFVSLALGYLRPVNGFVMQQQFTSAFVDTWSFKLGIGL